MEQENKKYEFKAISEKLFAFAILMIIPTFFTIYFVMHKYIFYDEKRYDVYTNLKTIGVPFVISIGFIFTISYLFFVKKYALLIKDYELLIYSNNSMLYSLPDEQIKKIKFVQSKKITRHHYNFILIKK